MNYYYPVYKNLEKELIKLSETIHFNDSQLGVYSGKIGDLLVRTAVEIEAITKELYFKNLDPKDAFNESSNNRHLYFDTDCLDYLEKKWLLSKRQVIITAHNFYFENKENRVLTPLNNVYKRSKCDWKKAYNAVKHDRTNNLKKANLKHLIRAMAALYLLNIYYMDLDNIKEANMITSKSFDSSVFSVSVGINIKSGKEVLESKGFDYPEHTYILIHKEEHQKEINKQELISQVNILNDFSMTIEYKEYIKENEFIIDKLPLFIIMDVGVWYLTSKVSKLETFKEKLKFLTSNPEYKNIINNFEDLKDINEENIMDKTALIARRYYLDKYKTHTDKVIKKMFKNDYILVLNKGQRIYDV